MRRAKAHGSKRKSEPDEVVHDTSGKAYKAPETETTAPSDAATAPEAGSNGAGPGAEADVSSGRWSATATTSYCGNGMTEYDGSGTPLVQTQIISSTITQRTDH